MARKYTPEEKARTMGALAASAAALDGNPDWRRVAEAEGIPYKTAHAWWTRCGEEERAAAVAAASRVKAERDMEEGASDVYRAMQARFRELVQAHLDSVPDGRWHEISKGLEVIGRILRDHASAMGLTVKTTDVDALLEDEMRKRMEVAGMLGTSEPPTT